VGNLPVLTEMLLAHLLEEIRADTFARVSFFRASYAFLLIYVQANVIITKYLPYTQILLRSILYQGI